MQHLYNIDYMYEYCIGGSKVFAIGKSYIRKDAIDKVSGKALYTADYNDIFYHAYVLTSKCAHAQILAIHCKEANDMQGVRAILTGRDYPIYTGPIIVDRPVLAVDRVLYYGEPVVIIVADTYQQAKNAANLIKIEYRRLKVINNVEEALDNNYPILHPDLGVYKKSVLNATNKDVFPVPNSNIANLQKIRKGDFFSVLKKSEVVIENTTTMEQSYHGAMETHCCLCEISASGHVSIYSSSQSPSVIKEYISKFFEIPINKVNVIVPYVGGAYGGKTPVVLECLCYLASRAVEGHIVKLIMPRSQDMTLCPVHIGIKGTVTLAATKDGFINGYHSKFYFDGGAYSDKAVVIARAAAQNCTGPYNINNVYCDSYCLYTNHTFATAYRGFGHAEMTLCIERAIDVLAKKLKIDPLKLREMNSIKPENTTPTGTILIGKLGNLEKCIKKIKATTDWNEKYVFKPNSTTIISRGIACFWKSFSLPPNAVTGAIITFNRDGSVNLITGLAEIGQGTKSVLAQIITEILSIPYEKINVVMKTNTACAPHDWKTAASRGLFMAGNATKEAAMSIKTELFKRASVVLRHNINDLALTDQSIYLKTDPSISILIKDIALGYSFDNRNSIWGEITGTGTDIVNGLTPLTRDTGRGTPGMEWTVGVQAVEVEIDTCTYQYKILKAYTVIDAGNIINPSLAKGQVLGGMNMGLSLASPEKLDRNREGVTLNNNLRTYPIVRYGEIPYFNVEFIMTPQVDGPFGARGIGEHGIIGMPAALSNALSNAFDRELNALPLLPETLWQNLNYRPWR